MLRILQEHNDRIIDACVPPLGSNDGTLNPTNDYSSRRGVLSCNPINEFVLRQAPGNATNGMQAPVGIGTNEPKGLQSMPEYPNNYPVMRPTNNFGMVM